MLPSLRLIARFKAPEHFDWYSNFLSIHFPAIDFQGILLFVSGSVLLKQFSVVWFLKLPASMRLASQKILDVSKQDQALLLLTIYQKLSLYWLSYFKNDMFTTQTKPLQAKWIHPFDEVDIAVLFSFAPNWVCLVFFHEIYGLSPQTFVILHAFGSCCRTRVISTSPTLCTFHRIW